MATTKEETLEKELRRAVDAARESFSESEVRRIVESELNARRQ